MVLKKSLVIIGEPLTADSRPIWKATRFLYARSFCFVTAPQAMCRSYDRADQGANARRDAHR